MHWPWSHLHRTLSGIPPYEARTFLTHLRGRDCLSYLFLRSISITYHAHAVNAGVRIKNITDTANHNTHECFRTGKTKHITHACLCTGIAKRITHKRLPTGNANHVTYKHFCPGDAGHPILHIKAASAHKLPANGIVGKALAADSQEIAQEFKQTLGFKIFRFVLADVEEKRFGKLL